MLAGVSFISKRKFVFVAPPAAPGARSGASVRVRSVSRAGVCCSDSSWRERGVGSGSVLDGVEGCVDGGGCVRRLSCAKEEIASVEIRMSVRTVFFSDMARDSIPGAVRAAILTGAMTFEPAPLDIFEIRVPAIRRVVDRIEPPLDLRVIPFRYRVSLDGRIAAVP